MDAAFEPVPIFIQLIAFAAPLLAVAGGGFALRAAWRHQRDLMTILAAVALFGFSATILTSLSV